MAVPNIYGDLAFQHGDVTRPIQTPGNDPRDDEELNLPWYDALDLPGGWDMMHVRELLLSRPFLNQVIPRNLKAVSEPFKPKEYKMQSNSNDRVLMAVSIALFTISAIDVHADDRVVDIPVIDGDWWQVAGNPDLGDYTTDKQEPVDFGVWRAADGTWQLWSCIRNTKCGGNSRLFYRWEGIKLTDSNWKPMGIAMEADVSLGETHGGLQAPYVIVVDGVYRMFYGDWNNICMATSEDGKNFKRMHIQDGRPALFSGPYNNTRDPMVLPYGELYFCYYVGHNKDANPQSAVFCRISSDLLFWSEPIIAAHSGVAKKAGSWFGSDTECPHVFRHNGLYYLSRTQRYGQDNLSTFYASPNPLAFGADDDRYRVGTLPIAAPEFIQYEGQDYVAALMPSLEGIRIAKLRWQRGIVGSARARVTDTTPNR